MDDLPEAIEVKLKRAEQHRKVLKEAAWAFLLDKPYREVRELHNEGRKHVYRVRITRSPPPLLSVIIGDCVHNLRSPLDHLVYQLALANQRRHPEGTGFPIYESPELFGQYGARQIAMLPDSVQAVIKALQPYAPEMRGVKGRRLVALQKLWNQDKHRLLVLTGAAVRDMGWVSGVDRIPRESFYGGRAFKDKTVIATFSFPYPAPDIDVHPNFGYEIAFERGGPGKGAPVLSTIDVISETVREIVDKLTPFLA